MAAPPGIMAAASDGSMAFRARQTPLVIPELEQLLRISPPANALQTGFVLQEADVNELLRAAKAVEETQLYIDPAYPPDLVSDLLQRTVRLLQVAMEFQYKETEDVVIECNNLREDYQDLEERERRAQEELDRMRQLRDKEQADGDVMEMRRKNDDLTRRLEDEQRANDRLRQQRDRDEEQVKHLEYRLKHADDELSKRTDEMRGLEDKLNRLQEDYTDLRQTYESLRAEHTAAEAKLQIGDTMRQHEWKISSLQKENRALELANTELRAQLQAWKQENLEVSEKIIVLDEENRKLKAREGDTEARVDQLASDKASLLTAQEELKAEVAEKVGLLDEFEARFQRQYKSWEEERATLQAQIEALRAGSLGGKGGRGRSTGGGARDSSGGEGGADADDEEVQDLRDQLNEAREKEILLLEAYEQLELSVAGEIDKALGKQSEELRAATRRVDFLTQRLEEERASGRALKEHQEQLEDQVKDAIMRNRQYEGGIYGMPQAVEEIHQLKDAVYKEQGRVRDLIQQVNKLSNKVEDLSDENTVLRRKAGVGENDKVDTKDVRMQKEATIAQLRSLNALLERQVADLEEERRKLRMELKFRAKYHGQHALEMGLTPDQLLLVEQYVDDIKNGRSDEARLVDQLTHRIEFLEVRLAEVMAYADIPPSMRPALTEYDPVAAITGAVGNQQGGGGAGGRGGFISSNIRAAQLEAVKAAQQKALAMLREMNTALVEKRSIPDSEYQRWTEGVISQLVDAQRALDAVLKDVQAAGEAGGAGGPLRTGSGAAAGARSMGGSGRQQGGGSVAGGEYAGEDAGFLADAMADELRERLKELARKVVDLQTTVIQKEAVIQQLNEQKADMERRFGVPLKDRPSEFVPRSDYEELSLRSASLKEQLVQRLEELASREREVADWEAASGRYQAKLQTYSDQVKLLYREYSNSLLAWRTEKLTLEKRIKKLQEDADGHKAAATEFARGLDTLTRGNLAEVQHELADTVRRMAVVQIKHAKIARELESVSLSERALGERVEELEQEVRDVSSTCRSRMRWLETAADAAKRRTDTLLRELQAAVPLQSYQMLSEKHARQQGELRRLVEEAGDSVAGPLSEEVFRLREECADLMIKYDKACNESIELREKLRIAETTLATTADQLHQAEAANAAAKKGLMGPVSTFGAPTYTVTGGSDPRSLDMRLAQELIAARVSAESAVRRAELVEAERSRLQQTLAENQTRLKEVEERMAQYAAEVELLRISRSEMEQRLSGSKTREEADELVRRLEVAEALAAEKHNDYTALQYRSEEAERKLEQAQRDRQRHLAQITGLRQAVRDATGRSEQASVVGRLHEQLDHAIAKESLARNALNRSELARIELEKEVRKLKAELTNATGCAIIHQDQARWANKQRQEAQAQLDISLAARTESWKAKLWARKLQHLKTRNDAIADTLDLARRRIKKLEDARCNAELKLETSEDMASLVRKGVSEVVRDAAHLHEQLLCLRMERGELQREEVLLREKVHSVERVNAELHELIAKYEAEFFQQQLAMEADKATAMAQSRQLQDELMKLQERLSALLASKEAEGPDARRSLGTLRVPGEVGGRLKAHLEAATAGDRQMMLKQIEALKAARQEAEHLRQEVHRLTNELAAQGGELSDVRRHLNDALQRLQQQSDTVLYALNYGKNRGAADESAVDQMRAVAEATVNELKDRLKDRDKQLEDLEKALATEKAAWHAQHVTDRLEIDRLNQCLFERNDRSIANLKGVLSRVPRGGDDPGGGSSSELAHLREALARANDDMAVLRNQLEQKDAALEVMRRAQEAQVRHLQAEADRLREELESLRRETDGPTARSEVSRLQGLLRAKDDRLKQLGAAFRALEGQLVEERKKRADLAMQSASWRNQEALEARVKQLEKEKADLLAALVAAREEAQAARSAGTEGQEGALSSLREQLQAARDRAAQLDQELARVRAQLQRLKNAERTVVDLTTGMSVEAKRQIDELQKRVNVLDKQNAALRRTLQNEEASGAIQPGARGGSTGGRGTGVGGGGSGGPDDGRGPGGGGSKYSTGSRPGTGSTSGRDTEPRPGTGGDGAGGRDQAPADLPGSAQPEDPGVVAARNASAVAQWEETKKLTRKVEELRKKMAVKQEELAAAKQEAEKRGAQVAVLEGEVDKQAAVIKDMQEKLRKAQAAPRLTPGAGKLKEYTERLAKAEAEADTLKAALARAHQQQQAGGEAASTSGRRPTPGQASAGGAAAAGASTSGGVGGDDVSREADLFELKLQRDQAQLQARRLAERLRDLFGPEASDLSLPLPPGSTSSGPLPGSARSTGGATTSGRQALGGAKGVVSAREAELQSTISSLRSALEKTTATSTPTTKYMAEVQKRKEAVRDLEAARAELDKLKKQGQTMQRMMAEMQGANNELRKQLRAAQEAAAAGGSAEAAAAAAAAQAVNFELLLNQRDAELAALRAALAEREREVQAAGDDAGLRKELAGLRDRLSEVEGENADLRAELNAFDPRFFEEIEDLKHEHYVLTGKVQEYERVVAQLARELGRPAPVVVGSGPGRI